jgi:hypothetical protein
MYAQALRDTARVLTADGKGLLAMDESTPTCTRSLRRNRRCIIGPCATGPRRRGECHATMELNIYNYFSCLSGEPI